MPDLIKEVEFRGNLIQIYNDWGGSYSFEILDSNRQYLGHIVLYPLNLKMKFPKSEILMHNQHHLFGEYDFYQEDMNAIVSGKGYCRALHDYFILNVDSLPIRIDSIYSSYKMTLDAGLRFWKRQVNEGKAIYVKKYDRYKLKLKLSCFRKLTRFVKSVFDLVKKL